MSRRSRLFVTTAVKDWGQSPLSRVPITTFLPEQLGADLWLDASDTNTITAAGGSVSQWNNKGSLGNFTQASGAVQPTTGATTLNGRNVIDFAGDYLTAVNTNEWKFLHDGTKYTMALVAKASGSNRGVLGNNKGSSNNVGLYWFVSGTTSIEHAVYPGGATIVISNTASSVLTDATYSIQSLLADPSNGTAANRSELFVNAGTAAKNNTSTAAVSSANPSFALQIGALGDDLLPLTGSIAEIVIVSGTNATETNRVALRNYLNAKWAVY
jgi:hypothetical protein